MGELLALTCGSCGEPMIPNVSTPNADGCLWICVGPGHAAADAERHLAGIDAELPGLAFC